MAIRRKPGDFRTAATRFLVRGAIVAGLAVSGVVLFSAAPPDVLASADGQANAARKKYVATRAITVDKATGRLRLPTAAETQALVDMLHTLIKPAPATADQTTLPSGAIAMKLDGEAAPVMLGRPNADGTTEVVCVTSFEEAAAFLGLVEDVAKQ